MLGLTIPTLISRVFTLMIAFTVHEFSHAFVADRFGDLTPRSYGRLTLNPLKHLDILGSLMLLVAGFGWAKPVPINPAALRRHSKAAVMWVSLAGPASNLLMAILVAIPLRLKLIPDLQLAPFLPSLYSFCATFFVINLVLMVFNLLPVAPLDGEKVLEFLLPARWVEYYTRFKPYGPLILLVIIFILPRFGVDVLNSIMNPIIIGLSKILLGG